MDDLISRQAAIDGLSKLRPRMIDTYEKDGDVFLKVRACDVNGMLKELPSAQPERKTGRWINVTNDESLEEEYECSVCGYELFYSNPTKFCPNCGAKMEKEN